MEDVEGDNRESRFGLYRSETSREEPSAAGHPFNRAEGVLYSTSAGHHQARIRVDSGLHTIQRRLVEQPMDGPLGAGRASALQPTVFACGRSISDRTVAGMFAGWSQRLAGGAPDCVGPLIIHELRWPEKIGAHGAAFDRRRDLNMVALALRDRLGVGVSFSATVDTFGCLNFSAKPPAPIERGRGFVTVYQGDTIVWQGHEEDLPDEHR